MNIFGRSLVLVLSAGAGLGVGASRTAGAAETDSMTVTYKDLNLSSPADARVLYARLLRGHRGLPSGVADGPRALRGLPALLRHSSRGRRRQVNAPQVLALHRAQYGQHAARLICWPIARGGSPAAGDGE